MVVAMSPQLKRGILEHKTALDRYVPLTLENLVPTLAGYRLQCSNDCDKQEVVATRKA